MRYLNAFLVFAAMALMVSGCGSSSSSSGSSKPSPAEASPPGDIPDSQAFVRYAPPGGGYSVKVPEGWARATAGGAVTFTDKLNSIRMESARASGPLTAAEARRTTPGAQVSTVTRPAGPATRVVYEADAPADPVTGKHRRNAVERYVFFHNGRRVVLMLAGPKGADNVDPWKLVTTSLRYAR
jgi:hypothetical protein